ncbi:sigma-54-dependent transcriptional regulator [Flexithrix dorotheae]|uniref:sigma-54-dependent transcriptional regulator n=1 Tax=Flexithrix dorotheae TaxID=70993 RepID=UPI00036EC73C|nr:sigma-54 dependent transcriptional regulator [Flexithrix dorotheae]
MSKTEGKILVVDDDVDVLSTAKMFLKQHFSVVQVDQHPENIPKLLAQDNFDLILLDMNFSKGDNDGEEGLFWLNKILEINPGAVVILITAYGEVDLAVKAIKNGAVDFVLKPWKNEKLLATINSSLKLSRSKKEVEQLKNTQKKLTEEGNRPYQEFVGNSPAIQRVFDLIDKVAATDANVLILGENGTGKELVARALHRKSLRKNNIFISVDLGAISETLFETELFGHVKGAFTDAKENRPGSFELASGGSIFLDEIGNLSLPLQAKLLTVIQNREVKRVGANRKTSVDIRLICATNLPLYEMVETDEFRQDLLYRINTVEIRLPSLRERKEDIPLLIQHFLDIYSKKYKKNNLRIDQGSISKLKKYQWPGNVRELQHAVERAVILSTGNQISAGDFPLGPTQPVKNVAQEIMTLEDMEQKFIREALERNLGNVSKTAKELGLTRTALYRRLNKHGL